MDALTASYAIEDRSRMADEGVPADFVPISGAIQQRMDRRLGYFGQERFVLFFYEPRGQEVIWNDGRSYGFSSGGWMPFLDDIEPLAANHSLSVLGDDAAASHGLVIDRTMNQSYFASRRQAESFVKAQVSRSGRGLSR